MSKGIVIATIAAASLALGACGSDGADADEASAPQRVAGEAEIAAEDASGKGAEPDAPARRGKPKKPTVVQVQSSQYGDVLFDGKEFVLYLFTKDGGNKSKCYGDCAVAWPPYVKKGPLKASDGVDQAALGKTERKDGSKQVTYHGHPLYFYEGDSEPGQILCHDVFEFGGDWLVVQSDGQPAP